MYAGKSIPCTQIVRNAYTLSACIHTVTKNHFLGFCTPVRSPLVACYSLALVARVSRATEEDFDCALCILAEVRREICVCDLSSPAVVGMSPNGGPFFRRNTVLFCVCFLLLVVEGRASASGTNVNETRAQIIPIARCCKVFSYCKSVRMVASCN